MTRDDGQPADEQLLAISPPAHGRCTVLTVHGELDLVTENRLVAAVTEAMADSDGRPVVLDLSALTFLSSSGCGHLVGLDRQARAAGVELRIVVGDAWAVFGPLAVTGLDRTLGIFSTVSDAVDTGVARASTD